MRPLAVMVTGLILTLPALQSRPLYPFRTPTDTGLPRFARTRQAIKDVHGTIRGVNHRRPSFFTIAILTTSGAAAFWMAGVTMAISAVLGLCLGAAYLARRAQIVKTRTADLNEFWPNYLDLTRSNMRSSSRALSYVLFDDTFTGTPFQMELVRIGRREFENSGNLEKSLHGIWESSDHNMTNFVCSALCDLLGSTTHQTEEQMKAIVATLRSHNALEREARSKLAGVRAARAFIVIIPVGMALAGVSFAGSIAPFTTPTSLGEITSSCAILAGCWYWSSRLMAFPVWPSEGYSPPIGRDAQ